jgi:hypothetical protein
VTAAQRLVAFDRHDASLQPQFIEAGNQFVDEARLVLSDRHVCVMKFTTRSGPWRILTPVLVGALGLATAGFLVEEDGQRTWSLPIFTLSGVGAGFLLAESWTRRVRWSGLKSSFLAKLAYQRVLQSASPSAVQFMHQETRRAFPVIAFQDGGMPTMDARIHAATELLSVGALKNRNVVPQGERKGVALIYEWTELGLRMLLSLRAATPDRVRELRAQIASVPDGQIPPAALRESPEAKPSGEPKPADMVEASKVDTTNDATTGESA